MEKNNIYTANSWNDLMTILKEQKNSLPAGHEIWYRGQNNSDYCLLPGLFRNQDGLGIINEEEIFNTYKKLSQRLSLPQSNEWNLLIDMQHYFVPTRLLDWSENLGVSLFFAVTNHKNDNDVALFLLDPLELNAYSKKNGIPNVPDENMGLSYVENYIKKIPFEPRMPIAIKSSYTNNRILAQRGMFTIHGDDLKSIEDLCPSAITKIIINNKAIPEIKEFLEIANINEITVYPDFNGIADYIRRKFY